MMAMLQTYLEVYDALCYGCSTRPDHSGDIMKTMQEKEEKAGDSERGDAFLLWY